MNQKEAWQGVYKTTRMLAIAAFIAAIVCVFLIAPVAVFFTDGNNIVSLTSFAHSNIGGIGYSACALVTIGSWLALQEEQARDTLRMTAKQSSGHIEAINTLRLNMVIYLILFGAFSFMSATRKEHVENFAVRSSIAMAIVFIGLATLMGTMAKSTKINHLNGRK